MRQLRSAPILITLLISFASLGAEVLRVDITRREPFNNGRAFGAVGTYELLAGRVFFAVDPKAPANARIADLRLATPDATGNVLFSSDLVLLRPSDATKARGSVLLEVLNRGTTEANDFFFRTAKGGHFDLPLLEPATLDDGLAFEEGFTLAYLGWETKPEHGTMHMDSPLIDVTGPALAGIITEAGDVGTMTQRFWPASGDCPTDTTQPGRRLTVKRDFDDPGDTVPTSAWHFSRTDAAKTGEPPCSVDLTSKFIANRLYEVHYQGGQTTIAGLGFAAMRDFASYLKKNSADSALKTTASPRILGYGYSQSARFLRSFLGQGFNADEQGRPAFDGLFIASAGAGGGSFNHRYAEPGVAGTSVGSDLRPVDMFPFSDSEEMDAITHQHGSVLALAHQSHTVPKIFTTLSSTEFWARFASLTYITVDGKQELPLDPSERLYFIAGTPHAEGPFPPAKIVAETKYEQDVNNSSASPAFRALLLDLDDWVAHNTPPPPSVYPRLTQLAALSSVHFPKIPGVAFPDYMPRTWRMDFGPRFAKEGIITNEPPKLGPEYTILLPQTDADGNDIGGIALPFLAVPLGTFTGWNRELPSLAFMHYLGGLRGSFIPFAATLADREASGDARPSIAERYPSRAAFLQQTRAAAEGLVARRLILARDIERILETSGERYDFMMPPAPASVGQTAPTQ